MPNCVRSPSADRRSKQSALFVFATLAGTITLAAIYLMTWLLGYSVPGLTTVYLLLLANLAVLLLGFGTVGEYIGRIYMETKKRPLFVIDRAINLDLRRLHGSRDAGLDPEVVGLPGTTASTSLPR